MKSDIDKLLKWTGNDTEWEILYLQHIGEFQCIRSDYSKLELLKKYKNASLKRDNWGSLNRDKILAFLDILILKLEKGNEQSCE